MMIVDVDHVSSVMQKKKKKIKTTKNMENTLCSLILFYFMEHLNTFCFYK